MIHGGRQHAERTCQQRAAATRKHLNVTARKSLDSLRCRRRQCLGSDSASIVWQDGKHSNVTEGMSSHSMSHAGRQCVGESWGQCVSGVWQHASRGLQGSYGHSQNPRQGEWGARQGAILCVWHQLCHAPSQPFCSHNALQLQVSGRHTLQCLRFWNNGQHAAAVIKFLLAQMPLATWPPCPLGLQFIMLYWNYKHAVMTSLVLADAYVSAQAVYRSGSVIGFWRMESAPAHSCHKLSCAKVFYMSTQLLVLSKHAYHTLPD